MYVCVCVYVCVWCVGDIAIIATRVQVETLRVDLELNLTIDLESIVPVPELVNFIVSERPCVILSLH